MDQKPKNDKTKTNKRIKLTKPSGSQVDTNPDDKSHEHFKKGMHTENFLAKVRSRLIEEGGRASPKGKAAPSSRAKPAGRSKTANEAKRTPLSELKDIVKPRFIHPLDRRTYKELRERIGQKPQVTFSAQTSYMKINRPPPSLLRQEALETVKEVISEYWTNTMGHAVAGHWPRVRRGHTSPSKHRPEKLRVSSARHELKQHKKEVTDKVRKADAKARERELSYQDKEVIDQLSRVR